MKLCDFDYDLPKELIAQAPTTPRDHSRLLVLNKTTSQITDKRFSDITDYLQEGDVLVMNNSKVFPARLYGTKKDTGGKIEVFLLQKTELDKKQTKDKGETWQCLMAGHGRKEDLEIEFVNGLKATVLENNDDGTWNVKFNKSGKALMDVIYKIGITPLPPYIKRIENYELRIKNSESTRNNLKNDEKSYQTVYADDEKIGSVAAPTAGLHFTPALMKKIKAKGVEVVYVTLHVGLGTFAPVKTENILDHKMHPEYVEIEKPAMRKILKAKSEGRRVIAVGTTSVRTLEAALGNKVIKSDKRTSVICDNTKLEKISEWVNIYIYPGYEFKIVDAMITNFHIPKSTLLMLVSAFAGKKNIDKAYAHAVKEQYRFYSYGDAMLIT